MNPFFDPLTSDDLLILQAHADVTAKALRKQLGSLRGRFTTWFPRQSEQIPLPVKQHMIATRLLNQAVKAKKSEGGEPIPQGVIKTLDESLKLIRELVGKTATAKLINSPLDPEGSYVDEHSLLVSDSRKAARRIPATHAEWYLNLGLMMNVYQATDDEELKKEIGFLIINYLAKVAPYGFEELNLPLKTQERLNLLFHHGFIEPGVSYNRESPIFDPYLVPKISSQIAVKEGGQLFVIGTKEIQHFFPLWFSVLPTNSEEFEEECSREIERLVTPLLENIAANEFADYIDPPLMVDFTLLLEKFLYSSSQEGTRLFEEKLGSLKKRLDRAINIAVARMSAQNPKATDSADSRQRLALYLRSNITAIIRGQVKGAGFIKMLSVFEDPKMVKLPKDSYILKKFIAPSQNFARQLLETNYQWSKVKWIDFINGTGIRMTPVEGRRMLLEFYTLEDLLELNQHSLVFYSESGPNAQFYKHPSQILQTNLFTELERRLANKELVASHPYLQVLGGSTVKLVKGLVKEISEEKWTRINADLDKRQVVQNCLFRLLQHLANAKNQLEDFGKFTQSIELAHYEMATLLALFSPFKPEDFPAIYAEQLECIPKNLRKHVKAGLTKSSMNTFTGINAALQRMHPRPYRIHQPEAHFEIVRSLNPEDSFKSALKSSKNSVELYVCEFNHNVNLDPKHQEYQESRVIDEIDALLKAKTGTTHLTVAVDCTIDYVNSAKAHELLSRFSAEIENGKLQFIFFQSGQKFCLLGMDHQYGSPFYRVDNSDACWKPFDTLTTHAAHQTDALSLQWFCLMNKYAPEAADDHRRLIFKNTQLVLANVPEAIMPGKHSPIWVCSAEKGVDSCFIDIKITGSKAGQITEDLKQILYQKFAEKNAKIHTRGGYGYFHPNVCFFPFQDPSLSGGTIRINPGLDLEETRLIMEFLQEAAAKYGSEV